MSEPFPVDGIQVDGIGQVLRTPEDRFAAITDYPWEPRYLTLECGLRMAYVDATPDAAPGAGAGGVNGETVLLLHGEPMWGYLYRTMIPPLVAAGCRVIVPDLIGFGRSDKPVDQHAYTYSRHVAWVGELLRHLDLRDVTFFGQDWGGLIGGRVVADHPDRFARLVFSNTGLPRTGPGLPFITAQAPLPPEMLANLGIDWRATVDDDDRIVPEAVQAMIDAGPAFYFLAWRVYSQEVAELWPSKVVPGWCVTPVDDATLAAYDAPFPDQRYTAGARRFPMLVPVTVDDPERLLGDAAWAVLEQWRKPALTIWGTHCPHTYMEQGNQFRANIPGASLPGVAHTTYHAGHYIQEDCGPEVAADMLAFIQRFPLP